MRLQLIIDICQFEQTMPKRCELWRSKRKQIKILSSFRKFSFLRVGLFTHFFQHLVSFSLSVSGNEKIIWIGGEKSCGKSRQKEKRVCFLSFDLFVLRRVQLQSSVHRLGSMSMCHRRFLHFFFFSSQHSSNDYFKFMTAKNAKFSATVYWKDGAAVPEKQVPAKKENAIRFACISDTHCKTKQFLENDELCMPACDVIIHAGDFTVRKENCLTPSLFLFL